MNRIVYGMRHRARICCLVLVMIAASKAAAAESVTLMWDSSTDSQVVGYRVYVGTQSEVYTTNSDVGNATSFVLSDAVPGQRYYFAASAYAADGVESPLSAEISGFGNAPPALTNPGNQTSDVGEAIALQLVGSDPYGEPVSYTATGLPAGLSLTQSTGLITGAPVSAGPKTVTATVTDGVLSDSKTFTWSVTAPNAPPALTNPGNQTSVVGQSVTLQLVGTDPEGTPVSYLATGLPAGLALSATTGRISGIPQTAGPKTVTATVTDGVLSDSKIFTWSITAPNAPPALTNPGNQTSVVGQSVTLQLVGSDPYGEPVSYKAKELPAGLSLAQSTGLITGTPVRTGTNTVTATVTDGVLSTSKTFTWSIVRDRTPPVVAITSPTSATSFTVHTRSLVLGGTATDETRVVSVWWSNNRGGSGLATGTSTWTATIPLREGTNVITITARDKAGNPGRRTITITVEAVQLF